MWEVRGGGLKAFDWSGLNLGGEQMQISDRWAGVSAEKGNAKHCMSRCLVLASAGARAKEPSFASAVEPGIIPRTSAAAAQCFPTIRPVSELHGGEESPSFSAPARGYSPFVTLQKGTDITARPPPGVCPALSLQGKTPQGRLVLNLQQTR